MDARSSGSLGSVWANTGRCQPADRMDPCPSSVRRALGLVLLQGLLRHDRDFAINDEVQAGVGIA